MHRKSWTHKQAILDSNCSNRIKGWIEQWHKNLVPIKQLHYDPDDHNFKKGYVRVILEMSEFSGVASDGRVEIQLPPSEILVTHRYLVHPVRLDFLPIVQFLEKHSSFKTNGRIPAAGGCAIITDREAYAVSYPFGLLPVEEQR